MSLPVLTPISQTSATILPSTGSISNVASAVPFGMYSDPTSDLYSSDFISGAVDQVSYVYKRLGGDVLDIELTELNVYAAYEEAVLEYSYIMNLHQAENILSNVLGNTTGTFDQDGQLKNGPLSSSLSGTHINLKYPQFDFSYSRRVTEGISAEVGVGGSQAEYSASFDVVAGQQDYDLQNIISSSAALTSSLSFYNKVGNTKVLIKKVYYKTPHATWRFFGYYGGINALGNLSSYGQYADDSTFEVVPVWQNRLQSMAFEDAIFVRNSHFSYELKDNKLRIFPIPVNGVSPTKMWVTFTIPQDTWAEDETRDIGVDGINNMGTLPFGNIPYGNINAIGKAFIRKYALALCKEMLGQIRGKIGAIPIPGESITLNADQLLAQAAAEKEQLKQELKDTLDKLTYTKLAASDAELVESTNQLQSKIPNLIYVG